ncbi:hypothetical protein [Oceanirhabdus sp. W0125-5]|uniref:hypothetical protein n=1 Tax=Oceanirhabdus sp. W0125-5 TaxID=2999116 RepID=UPI0022F30D57|nr:hypothetical protein [Oceanirhabdus sp. W0125-5]WBW96080.1 hypothetical protein OW730_20650 [Oceanirhabdus sp. W0125-5]
MSTYKIIREVQSGNNSDLELEEYLMMNNVFVLSNVMKEIVKRKIITPNIESRLKEVSDYRNKEHVLIGFYTIGHLSIATLVKLGFNKNEIDAYISLDDFDKKIVNDLVQAYQEVL